MSNSKFATGNLKLEVKVIIALLLLCGCRTNDQLQESSVLQDKLRSIDTIRLEDLSKSKPITVEQATAEVTEQVFDANVLVHVNDLLPAYPAGYNTVVIPFDITEDQETMSM